MADSDTYHLLLYTYVPDMLERRADYRDHHLKHIGVEREAGRVAFAGAFDPPSGAAIVFKNVDHAHVERFMDGDPYVQAGLVTTSRIERWNLV
ncbi:MAG: YciI family protein [Solirubrobacteraceae bacterium]